MREKEYLIEVNVREKEYCYSGSYGEGGPRNGGWGLRCIAQTPRSAFCPVFSLVSLETRE